MGKRLPGMKVGAIKEMSPLVEFVHDTNDIKERYHSLPKGEKQRAIVFASVVWGTKKAAKYLGLAESYVRKARYTCRMLTQEYDFIRDIVAARVFISKALTIAESIKIKNIPDDKKAGAVKALMDASDISRLHGVMNSNDSQSEEIVEMFYRVRKKVTQHASEPEEEPIDVTGEVKDVTGVSDEQ